jgi:hypothetical protein
MIEPAGLGQQGLIGVAWSKKMARYSSRHFRLRLSMQPEQFPY